MFFVTIHNTFNEFSPLPEIVHVTHEQKSRDQSRLRRRIDLFEQESHVSRH